jgi:tRNA(fMet)-specific endonuclease VapC
VHQHKDPAQQMLPYAELVERMEFLAGFTILPWDTESIALFREMKARKVATGTMDLKIGCVALAHDATVLTRNLVDFRRIPGLRVENWLD